MNTTPNLLLFRLASPLSFFLFLINFLVIRAHPLRFKKKKKLELTLIFFVIKKKLHHWLARPFKTI